MKIGTSDISMAASSRYVSQERKGSQILNSEGDAVNDSGVSRTETREISARARYVTSGDQTADLTREKSTRTEASTFEQTGAGREQLGYLASVYEWASDAIDQVVAAFEERAAAQNGTGSADVSGPGLQGQAEDTASSSVDFQITLYKKMADTFRSQARFLDPDEIRFYSRRVEMENTSVQAGGVVRTAEGREIRFSLDVQMGRSVRTETMKTARIVDPLVVDLTGSGISFSGEKRAFDLDGDGFVEEVAVPGQGSAFLALDLNMDGRVNSGLELFGPASGDGFSELALYDKDRNMWIDENDEIYDRLMVWIQDGSEAGVMKKLSEAGIGAIHLGQVASEFLMETDGGEAAGQLRSTGIALTEDGVARAVQQIDLMV